MEENHRLAAAHPHTRATTRDSRRPAPILIVDDSLTTRMLEQSILESAGHEVELSSSGEEGLEGAKLQPPDRSFGRALEGSDGG